MEEKHVTCEQGQPHELEGEISEEHEPIPQVWVKQEIKQEPHDPSHNIAEAADGWKLQPQNMAASSDEWMAENEVGKSRMAGENGDTLPPAASCSSGRSQWEPFSSDPVELNPLLPATNDTHDFSFHCGEDVLTSTSTNDVSSVQDIENSNAFDPNLKHSDNDSVQGSNVTDQHAVENFQATSDVMFHSIFVTETVNSVNSVEAGNESVNDSIAIADSPSLYSENLITAQKSNGRPRKGRKRKIPDQSREDRKRKCQLNQSYVNQRGKVVTAKEFQDFHCKDKCHEKVGIEERRKEFNNFWSLETYEAKVLFISSKVSMVNIKRKRVKGSSRRSCTRIYTLAGVRVCKELFTQTLRISGVRIDSYMKKTRNSQVITDGRGKSNAVNKLHERKVAEVISHINKFLRYRAQTSSDFLPSRVTVPFMYSLYKTEYLDPVSLSSYKKIFYSNVNLKSKAFNKDTECSTERS